MTEDAILKAIFTDPNSVSKLDDNGLRIYTWPGMVIVENNSGGKVILISDIAGKIISRKVDTVIFLNPGLYIITVGNTVSKVIIN